MFKNVHILIGFMLLLGAFLTFSTMKKSQTPIIAAQTEQTAEIASPMDSGHVSTLTTGSQAPDFTLPNADGEEKSLYQILENGPVILSFYRGGWCPICNDQLYAYQQILPEFEELGGQLVAVSPETPESEQDTISKNYLTFEVLSDAGNEIARLYDLIWSVPEDQREAFSQWLKESTGKTLAEFNGIDNYELPIPATFVIAQDGTVVYVFKEEDYKQRAKNEDIIQALENLNAHAPETVQEESSEVSEEIIEEQEEKSPEDLEKE